MSKLCVYMFMCLWFLATTILPQSFSFSYSVKDIHHQSVCLSDYNILLSYCLCACLAERLSGWAVPLSVFSPNMYSICLSNMFCQSVYLYITCVSKMYVQRCTPVCLALRPSTWESDFCLSVCQILTYIFSTVLLAVYHSICLCTYLYI